MSRPAFPTGRLTASPVLPKIIKAIEARQSGHDTQQAEMTRELNRLGNRQYGLRSIADGLLRKTLPGLAGLSVLGAVNHAFLHHNHSTQAVQSSTGQPHITRVSSPPEKAREGGQTKDSLAELLSALTGVAAAGAASAGVSSPLMANLAERTRQKHLKVNKQLISARNDHYASMQEVVAGLRAVNEGLWQSGLDESRTPKQLLDHFGQIGKTYQHAEVMRKTGAIGGIRALEKGKILSVGDHSGNRQAFQKAQQEIQGLKNKQATQSPTPSELLDYYRALDLPYTDERGMEHFRL